MWRFWLMGVLCVGAPANTKAPEPEPVFENALVIGKPQQSAQWAATPRIRVCSSTEASFSRIERAVRYWENNGYRFGTSTIDPRLICSEPMYGEIIITLPDGNFDTAHMASTRLYTDRITGKIVKAKILILPKNIRRDRVLEHEMGHALGWKHYNQRYHIMNSTWQSGGYDAYGVRKR